MEIKKRYSYEYPSPVMQEYYSISGTEPISKKLVGYDFIKNGKLLCKGCILAIWRDGHGVIDYTNLNTDEQLRALQHLELNELQIFDCRREKEFGVTIKLVEFTDGEVPSWRKI
ncbi:MAG: hypothetical protein ACRCZ0_04550 [Cetobacterium sp.]